MNQRQPFDAVLMYHSVSAGPTSASFRRYVVDPAVMEEHLARIADTGWKTTTISDAWTSRRDSVSENVVALTFDDGFADFSANVLPLLEKFDMTATLYVTSGYVGGSAKWLTREGESDRAILSWAELADVVASGRVEIGSHSHTHPEMDRLPFKEALQEASRSKAILEDHLRFAIRSFAYPFGYHARSARYAVQRAGYTSACAVDDLPADATRSRFAIPRLTVTGDTAGPDLIDLLLAPDTAYRRARSALGRQAWRSYRLSPLWRRSACSQ